MHVNLNLIDFPGLVPPSSPAGRIAVLVSGGIDSCVLVALLARQGTKVAPLYVRFGLAWENAEQRALERFLADLRSTVPPARLDTSAVAPNAPRVNIEVEPLTTLELPLGDVYPSHWSVTGRAVPDASSPDEAVYLPGRNALLAIKAVLWCSLNRIDRLAIGTLAGNPFPDATRKFWSDLEGVLAQATGTQVRLQRPLESLGKSQVLELGRGLKLEHTFSCLAPVGDLHCGRCNKCAERRTAFRRAQIPDRTSYATNADRKSNMQSDVPSAGGATPCSV